MGLLNKLLRSLNKNKKLLLVVLVLCVAYYLYDEHLSKQTEKYTDEDGKEKTKSGIFPEDTKDFLFFLRHEINLPIEGLMCIPPIEDDPKIHFSQLQNLAKENSVDKLSIGMSGDYEEALPFKPAYIRLGTILFGKRN